MKPITTTETAIVIPFDTLIALYDNGCLDPALLAYCLPTAIAGHNLLSRSVLCDQAVCIWLRLDGKEYLR